MNIAEALPKSLEVASKTAQSEASGRTAKKKNERSAR
jgi:hypothetical protein